MGNGTLKGFGIRANRDPQPPEIQPVGALTAREGPSAASQSKIKGTGLGVEIGDITMVLKAKPAGKREGFGGSSAGVRFGRYKR